MNAKIQFSIGIIFTLLSTTCSAAISFTSPPAIKHVAQGWQVTFAVNEPTDVEVAVIDANDTVVRHLAAGMLGGPNPPPAPLQAGLSQQINWDGKDDSGNICKVPVSLRVRAGMQPKFDRFLLTDPNDIGFTMACAIGPQGSLYVISRQVLANGNSGGYNISVFDRDAKHQRTLMPFPATIAPDRIKAAKPFYDSEGRVVPRIYNWERLSFYPDPITSRGVGLLRVMPAVDSNGRIYWLNSKMHLTALEADGGIPFDDFYDPQPLLKDFEQIEVTGAVLAMSSDNKYVYLSGFSEARKKGVKTDPPLIPCVFRIPTDTRVQGEVFLGKPEQPGTTDGLLTAPLGICVVNGNIYVVDSTANRIVAFNESDGSEIGSIAVENPRHIAVDSKSGAIYVTTVPVPKKQAALIKIDSLKSGKELYRIVIPWTNYRQGEYYLALDSTGEPPRIWIPAVGNYSPFKFQCIEDLGDKFNNLGDPRPKPEGITAMGMRDLTVDRLRGELFVKSVQERWHRIDDRSGEVIAEIKFKGYHMASHATQILPCPDGSLVTLMWSDNWLKRWNRDGTPLNWEGTDSNRAAGDEKGIMTYSQKYLAVHGDEIYQVIRTGDKKYSSVNVYGMDGKVKRTAIWQCRLDAVPRIDPQGNLFIGANVRPVNRAWPEFFDDKLEPAPARLKFNEVYWYSYMYGSIIKFTPQGGALWYDQQATTTALGEPPPELLAKPRIAATHHRDYTAHIPLEIQGAEWLRLGFAPAHMYQGVGGPTCMCEGAGYDIDGYGRIFYPNLGQFRVEIIDNNNNFIGHFGNYGNADSIGAGKALPSIAPGNHPDIPLAWPTYVAVSDNHVYVNDNLSHRLTRVKLNWQTEAKLEVK